MKVTISVEALSEGTIAGIAAAVVLAVWAEMTSFLKTCTYSRKVNRSISNFGIGDGIRGITITAYNKTGIPIYVRRASIVSKEVQLILNPNNEITNIWKARELSIGETREAARIITSEKTSKDGPFPEVPPFSSRTFLLHPDLVVNIPFTPTSITFVIEHHSFPEGSKIIEVVSGSSIVTLLQSTVTHFRSEFETGNLNKVRAQFRLPPIIKR